MRDRPALDPLTETVTLLRPRGLLWKQATASGEWAVRYPAHNGAVFCLVAGGSCVFQMPGRAPTPLREGDFVLLTAPPVWTLGSEISVVPLDFVRAHISSGIHKRSLGRGKGPATKLLGGHFRFDDANAPLLDSLLPAVIVIRSSNADAGRLRAVLDLIGNEASSDRPGRNLVLERMLEVLLIEAIRSGAMQEATGTADRQGLLAGLADSRIAAVLRAPWRYRPELDRGRLG